MFEVLGPAGTADKRAPLRRVTCLEPSAAAGEQVAAQIHMLVLHLNAPEGCQV